MMMTPPTDPADYTQLRIQSQGFSPPPSTQMRSRAASHNLSCRDSVFMTLTRTRSFPIYIDNSEERFVCKIKPLPSQPLDETPLRIDPIGGILTQTSTQPYPEQTGLLTPANQIEESDWSAYSAGRKPQNTVIEPGTEFENICSTLDYVLRTPEEQLRVLSSLTPSPAAPVIHLEGDNSSRTSPIMDQLELFGRVPGTSMASASSQQPRSVLGGSGPRRRLTESAQIALTNCMRDSPLYYLGQRMHANTDSALLSQSRSRSKSMGLPALSRIGSHVGSPKQNLNFSSDPTEWSQTASGLGDMSSSPILNSEPQTMSPIRGFNGIVNSALLNQFTSQSSSKMPPPLERKTSQSSGFKQSTGFTISPAILNNSPTRFGEQNINFAIDPALLTLSPPQLGIVAPAPVPRMGSQSTFSGPNSSTAISSTLLGQQNSSLASGSASGSSPPVPVMESQTPQTSQVDSIPSPAGPFRKRKQFDIMDAFDEVAAKRARRGYQV